MTRIFVNLKRFDVPRSRGGICPEEAPARWIAAIFDQLVKNGLAARSDVELPFLLPEALLISAADELDRHPRDDSRALSLGSQGVYRNDVQPGGNFGAFTTLLPAAAAANLGARWSIIGHSEERRDKLEIMATAARGAIDGDDPLPPETEARHHAAVDMLVNRELRSALARGLDVLFCMGETQGQRGSGSPEEQRAHAAAALEGQVARGLEGVKEYLGDRRIVIGYEPIWAIGPGKTPPDGAYIDFVAQAIKDSAMSRHGIEVPVVYGGGLKEANAAEIAGARSVDGGLVALTRFTDPIGFHADDLKKIVETYVTARERS